MRGDRRPAAALAGAAARLAITVVLLAELDEAELRGVLGHELAHVSGRDILASTVARWRRTDG